MSKNKLMVFFARRLKALDSLIEKKVVSYFEQHKCDYDLEYFISQVIDDVDMEFEWFYGDRLDDDEIEEVPFMIDQYIREHKLNSITSFYKKKCSKQ